MLADFLRLGETMPAEAAQSEFWRTRMGMKDVEGDEGKGVTQGQMLP